MRKALTGCWTIGRRTGATPVAEQLADLSQIVETGPDRKSDKVVRWRRVDLKRVIAARFGVDYHERYVGKLLKRLGFSHISARPRHPKQDGEVLEAFKKTSRGPECSSAGIARRDAARNLVPDEARIGQKNGRVRQWARRGTRPRQPADQRYDNAYLFGAICPARGTGAALALPFADTEAMQLHLDEYRATSPKALTPR